MRTFARTAALVTMLSLPACSNLMPQQQTQAPAPQQQASANPMLPDRSMSTYRMHGVVVVNDYNQPWGVIQDVVMRPSGEAMAIVSVDKTVGHPKMVAVPMSHLTMMPDGRVMMHGANRQMAEQLPEFTYDTGIGGG
jgi:hypothetical protein